MTPHSAPDKRQIATAFRARLLQLLAKRSETLTSFARRCGLDRSALSQFLDKEATRLPRAETLFAIAQVESVSIDWLLGLSQNENALAEVAPQIGIEIAGSGADEPKLAEWHREAIGYKIRYVPSTLPDLLRTDALIRYEFGDSQPALIHAKEDQSKSQLSYSRQPETDMEVVMPYQRLEDLAAGAGIWSGLSRGAREAQLLYMADLLNELYPTFRLFLFDGRRHYCAPLTIFGLKRAAVYLGNMYLVIHSVDHIRALTARFDRLIRASDVGADKVHAYVSALKVG